MKVYLISETCQNPYYNCSGRKPTDIVVDVCDDWTGTWFPICSECWKKIAQRWEDVDFFFFTHYKKRKTVVPNNQ